MSPSGPAGAPISLLECAFAEREADIRAVRLAVFVAEQGIDEAIDFDGTDPPCHHVLAYAPGGVPVGTGRLQPDGRIGRIAVLRAWRGRGIGRRITLALVAAARTAGHREVTLHAQASAIDFYARLGFRPRGGRFLEAAIEHQTMVLALAGAGPAPITDAGFHRT